MVCFPGAGPTTTPVPFGDWKPGPFNDWLKAFNRPTGGTPLGNAILEATKLVADSRLEKKHIVVLTDGQNNGGISSDDGVRQGLEFAKKKGSVGINFYFVAFDTDETQFQQVKKKKSK